MTSFHLGQRLGGLKYSPDGQYLVVTSLDQSIQFLDAKTAQRQRELFGHNGTAMDVGLSEDGRIVATCGLDGSVKVWELARQAGSRRRIIPGPFLADLAFVPGSRFAAVASAYNTTGIRKHEQPTLKLWDVERGEFTKALPGHSGWLTSVAADPNGRWILTGSEDQSAILWDARQFTQLHTLAGHSAAIKAVAFLDQGNVAATVAADGEMRFWNPADGKQRGVWKSPAGSVTCIAGHPSQPLVAVATGETIVVVDAATLEPRRELKGEGAIRHLAYSRDGNSLAAARDNATIDLWQTAAATNQLDSRPKTLKGHTDAVTSVSFSPDGQRLASSSVDRTVKLWDVFSHQEVMSLPGAGLTGAHSKVAFSADGSTLLHVDQTAVDVWDVQSSHPAALAAAQLSEWHAAELQRAASGGHWFAAALHGEQLVKNEPQSAEYLTRHGVALAHLGQAERAIQQFQTVLDLEFLPEAGYDLALLQLREGDRAGYEKTAAAYLAAFGRSENAVEVNDALWTCALGSRFIAEHPEVVALAEQAAAKLKSPAALNTLGSVYLRAGRPRDAVTKLREGIRRRGNGLPQDWIVLALAYAADGNRTSAAEELQRTKSWLAEQDRRRAAREPTDAEDFWTVRMELEILVPEAEQAISAK